MTEFPQTYYRTGRGVIGAATFVGWVVFVAGLAVAVLGVASFLRAPDALGAMAQAAAVSAGLGTALVGILGVAAAQHMRATFDIADMTREMLALAKRRPSAPSPAPVIAADGPERPVLPSLTGGPRAPLRAEAGPVVAPRPKGEAAKVHPIFSARPPR